MSEFDRTSIEYKLGLPESLRREAAILHDEASGHRLSPVFKDETLRLEFLAGSFCSEFALVAIDETRLVGLLGFRGRDGSFTGGLKLGRLFDRLGWWAGLRALVGLALLDQRPRPGELIVEGLAVTTDRRGQGIGTNLLEQLVEYARNQGYQRLTLEIEKDNTRARKLVERLGFKPLTIQHAPIFWGWLGLRSVTTLEKRL